MTKLFSIALSMILPVSIILFGTTVFSQSSQSVEEYVQEQHNNLFEYLDNTETITNDDLEQVLSGLVDSKQISKRVLGKANYEQCTPEQFDLFDSKFKNTLFKTYAVAIKDIRNIRIDNVRHPKQRKDLAVVRMTVKDYQLVYKMVKLNDVWTVVGIVFNGIDIVRLYKDQFNRHKFDNKGDLNSAIETWK